jgi:RNA polymerase sigma-70 factor (ECF subfamily)
VIRHSAIERRMLDGLLARIASGDRRAFGQLYDRTSPIVFGVLIRMLNRPDWAQAALQDSYIRVWNRAETYVAERSDPIAWLIGIARYRALDLLREQNPDDRIIDDSEAVLLQLQDPEQNPEAQAIQRDAIERLDGCLRTMREEERVSLLLAYYQGYSHRELAQAMKAPLGTVKAWVRRGLSHLRACLIGESA